MLKVIESRKHIATCHRRFKQAMTTGLRRVVRNIGFPGGSADLDAYYDASLRLWSSMHGNFTENRYWNAFGPEDLVSSQVKVGITTEINYPHHGINRRVAAAWAVNADGDVFLVHSGKVGGGFAGVGKKAFIEHLIRRRRGTMARALWGDSGSDVLVLGALEDPGLRMLVRDFVYEVADFKKRVRAGEIRSSAGRAATRTDAEPVFTPEFTGERALSAHLPPTAAICHHGRVVLELEQAVAKALHGCGCSIGNDRKQDLVAWKAGRVEILFEVKTDTATSSIYGGVGQLMLHGAVDGVAPVRVLVLPEEAGTETARRLDRLGIQQLVYSRRGETVTFHDMRRCLSKLIAAARP